MQEKCKQRLLWVLLGSVLSREDQILNVLTSGDAALGCSSGDHLADFRPNIELNFDIAHYWAASSSFRLPCHERGKCQKRNNYVHPKKILNRINSWPYLWVDTNMKKLLLSLLLAPSLVLAGSYYGWDSNGNYYNGYYNGNSGYGWDNNGNYYNYYGNGNSTYGWDSNGNYYQYYGH